MKCSRCGAHVSEYGRCEYCGTFNAAPKSDKQEIVQEIIVEQYKKPTQKPQKKRKSPVVFCLLFCLLCLVLFFGIELISFLARNKLLPIPLLIVPIAVVLLFVYLLVRAIIKFFK